MPKVDKTGQTVPSDILSDDGMVQVPLPPLGGGTKVVLHRASGVATQTIPAATWTKITGWSVLHGDAGMKGNDTIKISEDGKYLVGAGAIIDTMAGLVGVRIVKNGVDTVVDYPNHPEILAAGLEGFVPFAEFEVTFSSGDYIEAQYYSQYEHDLTYTTESHPLFFATKLTGD